MDLARFLATLAHLHGLRFRDETHKALVRFRDRLAAGEDMRAVAAEIDHWLDYLAPVCVNGVRQVLGHTDDARALRAVLAELWRLLAAANVADGNDLAGEVAGLGARLKIRGDVAAIRRDALAWWARRENRLYDAIRSPARALLVRSAG